MNPKDEKELHRLSELLHDIDRSLAPDSPQREALMKAGLALGMIFLQSARGEIERIYEGIGQPVKKDQKKALKAKGIKPAPSKAKKKPKAKRA
jgi:hypothetical protein